MAVAYFFPFHRLLDLPNQLAVVIGAAILVRESRDRNLDAETGTTEDKGEVAS